MDFDEFKNSTLMGFVIEEIAQRTGAKPCEILADFEKFNNAIEKLMAIGYSQNESTKIVTTIWEFPFLEK